MLKIDNFPYPTPAKILGCYLWSGSIVLGSAKRGKVRLISHKIIFQIQYYMRDCIRVQLLAPSSTYVIMGFCGILVSRLT